MGWFPEQAGGLNRYFQELLAALPDAGVSARALVVGERGDPGSGVSAVAPACSSLPRRLLAFHRAIRATERPDVLVSHFALYANAAVGLHDGSGRVPHVVHFHGPWAQEGAREGAGRLARSLKKVAERRAYRRADRFITLSRAFADVLTLAHGVDPTRVRVIPGGVDTARFHPGRGQDARSAARVRLGWPTERPIVFAVRRLVPRMGLDALLTAFARVRVVHPRAFLVIAGKGPERERLEATAAAAGLLSGSEPSAAVRFTGYLPDADLPDANRAADLAVVPTESLEGFGLITLEALASGTPVLVTPVGGLPEVVAPLDRRLVLEATGVAALAAGISAALHRPDWLPDRERCASYAAEGFAWPVIAERIAAVYREAADAADRGGRT